MAKPSPEILPTETARRLLMRSQGLCDPTDRPATPKRVQSTIEQMGFVQVDSINMVHRAHHLILHTRFDRYEPKTLKRLLERDRALFEHWTHDASIIPTRWFDQWKAKFAQWKGHKWYYSKMGDDPQAVLDHVRERIEEEGPLFARDFEFDRNGESGSWWGWKPQKAALEHLWHGGDLLVDGRHNFQKRYDLPDRVMPDHHELDAPDRDSHVDWACSEALERLGHATAAEIGQFWNLVSLQEARAWVKQALADERVVPVQVPRCGEGKPVDAVAVPDWKKRGSRRSAPPDHLRILCPFDPVIRDRKRLERLFGFDYRFEAFVPAPKRKYGYYVLPLLKGDRFVGRINPKTDRQAGILRVNGVWWEPNVRPTAALKAELDDAVGRLAAFCGVDRWSIRYRRKPDA